MKSITKNCEIKKENLLYLGRFPLKDMFFL